MNLLWFVTTQRGDRCAWNRSVYSVVNRKRSVRCWTDTLRCHTRELVSSLSQADDGGEIKSAHFLLNLTQPKHFFRLLITFYHVFRPFAANCLWSVPSACLQAVIRPDKGSTVTVSTELPLDQCSVCTVSGVNDTQTSCLSSQSLVPEVEIKLLFNCSQPIEQAYTVVIARTIGEFTGPV